MECEIIYDSGMKSREGDIEAIEVELKVIYDSHRFKDSKSLLTSSTRPRKLQSGKDMEE